MIDDFFDSLFSGFSKLVFLVFGVFMGWVLVQAGLTLWGALP